MSETAAPVVPLQKFNVHIFTEVRVKVIGVEATDAKAALSTAENSVIFHEVIDQTFRPGISPSEAPSVECVEWTEGASISACVDPILSDGEVDYEHTIFLDGEGNPLVEGKTLVERKAAAFDVAGLALPEGDNKEEYPWRVSVDGGALASVLRALNGSESNIRELQVTRKPPFSDTNPINILCADFDAAAQAYKARERKTVAEDQAPAPSGG